MIKKSFLSLLTGSILSLSPALVHSQDARPFTGDWQGTLSVGVDLRIVFHIRYENGAFFTTADSPDQSAYGLKCDTTYLSGAYLTISMKDLQAKYTGKLTNDSTMDGIFTQGADFELKLKRTGAAAVNKRPQTPAPPFSYNSSDIIYPNADNSLQYGATITVPPGKGPFPAAILITGSGPQDRDETVMGHKIFAVIADALTREGLIVLRVDDRGVGKSTGVFADATSADFAKDVNAGLNYLLTRTDVNKKRLGLIGHSEGGMIAPIVASERKDVFFSILLAGPGIPIMDLMLEQNAAILKTSGVSESAAAAYLPFYRKIMQISLDEEDSAKAYTLAIKEKDNWAAKTDSAIVKELGFDDVVKGNHAITQLVNEFSGKWFRYFLRFDPQPNLRKMNGKVLAINGEKDIQVISASNLAGIESAMKQRKVKNYTVKSLPQLNHLFQTCIKCTLPEYGELTETISPIALDTMRDWLKKEVL